MTTIRLATVKATGKRYVVQQMDLRRATPVVHCWGEVSSFRLPGTTKHRGSKTFILEAVDVTEVERTAELLTALWHQGLEALRAEGHGVHLSRTGRTATIYKK